MTRRLMQGTRRCCNRQIMRSSVATEPALPTASSDSASDGVGPGEARRPALVQPGDTVGVLDWDSNRFLQAFVAIPMMGAVLQIGQHIAAMHGVSNLGCRYQLLAMTGWTSLPWLGSLRRPSLILMGNDDPLVSPINSHILAHLIPNTVLRMIDDGHLLMVTQPGLLSSHFWPTRPSCPRDSSRGNVIRGIV